MPRSAWLAALALVGSCVQLGIRLDDSTCRPGASALDADESQILAEAARSLYDEGELKISGETALRGDWPEKLRSMDLAIGIFRVPTEAVDDLEARNSRPGCLRVPQADLEVSEQKPRRRSRLTLSRPGFDRSRQSAIIVYRLVTDDSGTADEEFLVLRKAPKRGWNVINAVKRVP